LLGIGQSWEGKREKGKGEREKLFFLYALTFSPEENSPFP
jgi:hypothetical protein